LSNDPWNHNTRAAGLSSEYALIVVDQVLLHWCTSVVVMDKYQQKEVLELLYEFGYDKPVYNLNVPDAYNFRDDTLVEMITTKLLEVFPVEPRGELVPEQ
jgi:predicted protein tyrosine phosphatase